MAEKKLPTEKESSVHKSVPSKKETAPSAPLKSKISVSSSKKIKDLKIELLKNPTKRKSIKKEIARLLTMARRQDVLTKDKTQNKSDGENK